MTGWSSWWSGCWNCIVGAGHVPARNGRPPRGAPTIGDEDIAATELDREIAATDAEIDELVYELYGITAAERTIIEEAL